MKFPARDCNLSRRDFDHVFSDGSGWAMRRYQWHIFYAGLSTAAAEGIHRATKMPRWASALTASVGIGLLPHVRQAARGIRGQHYELNAPDWGFDLFNRSAPLLLYTGASGGNWQAYTLAATTEVAGYFALACYATP